MDTTVSDPKKQHQALPPARIDSVDVTDPYGREKSHPMREAKLFIGYDPGRKENKLSIRAEAEIKGEEKWCVEVMAHPTFCRLVNKGKWPIEYSPANGTQPNGAELFKVSDVVSVAYERKIEIEGHTFIFHRRRKAPSFEVSIKFSGDTNLHSNHTRNSPLEGAIRLKLRHKEEEVGKVQFLLQMTIPGITANAYHLDSSFPKLVRADEEIVKFSLYHPAGSLLPAGGYEICVLVRAEEFEGEEAIDFKEFLVQPIYDHQVDVVNPFECRDSVAGGQT